MTGSRDASGAADAGLRQAALRTAAAMVAERGGLRVRLEGMSLDAVIRAAGAPRTSVYRIWPNREAFHLDLLCALADPDERHPDRARDVLLPRVRETVARAVPVLGSLDGRQALLRELCACVATEHFHRLTSSVAWRNGLALTATTVSLPPGADRARVIGAMRSAELVWSERMAGLYRDISIVLGGGPGNGMTYQQLAIGAAALVDGLGLRALVMPDRVGARVRVPAAGARTDVQTEDWPLVAYLLYVYFSGVWTFAEDYDGEAALSDYVGRSWAGRPVQPVQPGQPGQPGQPAQPEQPGQQPAGTDAGLRAQILDAAVALAGRDRGLRVGLDGPGLDAVVRAADVPRTSAYRVWPNREAFHRDLMCSLAATGVTDPVDPLALRVGEVVARRLDLLATAAGRRDLLRDLCAAVVQEHYEDLTSSTSWRNTVAITATFAGIPGAADRERLRRRLAASELARIEQTARVCADLGDLLGASLRDGLDYQDLALAVSSLGVGLALRAAVVPDLVRTTVRLDAAPDAPGRELPLVTYLILTVLESAWRFSDDYDAERALATYVSRRLAD